MSRPAINHSGSRYGRLLVLDEYVDGLWKCVCDCGSVKWYKIYRLKNGSTRSCGCYRREFGNIQNMLDPKEAAYRWLFKRYQIKAKSRNIDFALNSEQFRQLIDRNCHYCGSIPNNVYTRRNKNAVWSYIYNGIDRVDNSIGYTIENCVTCCAICNRSKETMSVQEFYNWIERVFKHIGETE